MKNTDLHIMHFGQKPELEVFVPGSINFFGVLSSFYRGSAVVGTDDNGLTVTISKANSEIVTIVNNSLSDNKKFKLSQLKLKKDDRYAGYVKGLYVSLSSRGKKIPAVNVVLDGPALSAVCSLCCSSITIGILTAFNEVFALGLKKEDFTRITGEVCSFNNLTAFDEHIFNLIYTEEGSFSIYDHAARKGVTSIKLPKMEEYAIYTIDTNIPYDTVKEEYADIQNIVSNSLLEFRNFYTEEDLKKYPSYSFINPGAHLSNDCLKVCNFLHNEYVEVCDVRNKINKGDISGIGKALYRYLVDSHKCFEFFCPEKNWLEKRLISLKGCLGVGIVYSSYSVRISMIMKKSDINQLDDIFADYNRIFSYKASLREYTGKGSVRIIK